MVAASISHLHLYIDQILDIGLHDLMSGFPGACSKELLYFWPAVTRIAGVSYQYHLIGIQSEI